MERLYASYRNQIEFLIVYIREAHPNMLRQGNQTGIVGRPKTFNERIILATACVTKFKLTIPMVIDGIEGKVNNDYKAAPVRVTITDLDGKVAYYAGPGPFDFRLDVVEKVLKKLVANRGYMPLPPQPQWGKSVKGLRCGLSFDPENPILNEEVTAYLKFENTSDKTINLYYQPAEAAKQIIIRNDKGQTFAFEPIIRKSRFRRNQRTTGLQSIAPGESFAGQIDGKIVAASDSDALTAGAFLGRFHFDVNENTIAQVDTNQPLWRGELSSGACKLDVTLAAKEGCIDCHGQPDYHHAVDRDCTQCHTGQSGSDDFTTKKESCIQCHPRPGIQGRRQILGQGGEIDLGSKHIPGMIENKDCLLCHDSRHHQSGVVKLIDPHSAGTKPWTGARTDFCLSCHDGYPPSNVTFPAAVAGTGYDKSSFPQSTHAKWLGDISCLHCHNAHGSSHRSLLKGKYVLARKTESDSLKDNYTACWLCHEENRVVKQKNSFEDLHDVHLNDEKVSCFICHDVHASHDKSEPGLICFQYGHANGFDVKYLEGCNADTAFRINAATNTGTCSVTCHQMEEPKEYSRVKKTHTVSCLHCHQDETPGVSK